MIYFIEEQHLSRNYYKKLWFIEEN